MFGGRFNGGFFALRVWGAYTWRGLLIERGPSKTTSRGAWLPEYRSGQYGEDVVYFRY